MINIGNANEDFVPSKTFEYIGTGKPIINFYYGSKPDSVMERYPIVINIPNEQGKVDSNMIESEICKLKNSYISNDEIEMIYPENTAHYIKEFLMNNL